MKSVLNTHSNSQGMSGTGGSGGSGSNGGGISSQSPMTPPPLNGGLSPVIFRSGPTSCEPPELKKCTCGSYNENHWADCSLKNKGE